MSAYALAATPDRPVFATLSNPVRALVTSSRPVNVHVTLAPVVRFPLDTTGNFVRVPVIGGGYSLFPYSPE